MQSIAEHAPSQAEEAPPESTERRRTIKRYSNRKLYDTRQSRYVTLLQIAEMVRSGEDVEIIDNASKEDKTDVTLALIISEELKARPRAIPLATLKALVRNRGGRFLTQLRDSPIGRLLPGEEGEGQMLEVGPTPSTQEDPLNEEQARGLRRTLEQWQLTIDDRIRTIVPQFSTIQELKGEIQSLNQRVKDLEKQVANGRE